MSSQLSILSKIPGKGFWTAPSREQYLPAFFKEVCDNYLRDPDARELIPVKVSLSTFWPLLLVRNLKFISETKINYLSNFRYPATLFTCAGLLWRTRYISVATIRIPWDANKWPGILEVEPESPAWPTETKGVGVGCVSLLWLQNGGRRGVIRSIIVSRGDKMRGDKMIYNFLCVLDDTRIKEAFRMHALAKWRQTRRRLCL